MSASAHGFSPAALRMNDLDWLQWPAMLVTVAAAWLVASRSAPRRVIGFWCFLLSNLLWVVWAWQAQAWALIVLQVCLAALNTRGVLKNEPRQPSEKADA
jgi:hypothetical protein